MKPILFLLAVGLAAPASAQVAPYAGQDARPIASLSDEDIAALEAGEGWGLAKPAELNGYPGPRHVLDMADELRLSAAQKAEVQAIFDEMNAAAREAGARLIAAERALDAAFEAGGITPEALDRLLAEAGAARTALRGVHLHAHLVTAPLLNPHQTWLYNRGRGYAAGGAGHAAGHGNHDEH